ncbi:MAG: hypothetical protein KIT79_01940 [Deltaproteobacteria bacterium]|nr:hypothetical protein [Deltaproteobacteria bacterium]
MPEHDSDSGQRDEREGRRRLGDRLDGIVPDSVKKAIYTSLGAVFMTEDSVRRALADIKVPGDAVSYFINQSKQTKEELFNAIAREVASTLLKDRDPVELLQAALQNVTVTLTAEVDFKAKEDPAAPGMEVKVRAKRR